MPDSLVKSDYIGRVVWLGRVEDRTKGVEAQDRAQLALGFGGPEGEAHSGLTRPSCGRVMALYERGTEIANVRQLSVLSAEELAQTAQNMGVEALDPAWVGASLVLEGVPDFTHLPPNSRLQGPSGVTIVVDMENLPCTHTGKAVDAHLPGMGKLYKPAAMGLRGVTAWVERPGTLALGDELRLFCPAQRAWRG